MDFDWTQARKILSATPATLRAWLSPLSAPWVHGDYGPGTFSPYDVVGHLIHGERADWVSRARLILEHGVDRSFEPFDRYAMFEESRRQTLSELLDAFESLRRENLEAVEAMNLTPERLALQGAHPALGTVTLKMLLATWAVHDLNHVAQIAKALAFQYAEEVGPWKAYLSILTPPTQTMDEAARRRRAAARE